MNRMIFVMAQGPGSRWHPQHERTTHTRLALPIYKQCLPVNGEPLIVRTCRMLKADCTVVAPPDLLAEHHLPGVTLPEPGTLLEGIIQMMDFHPMAEEIIVLLGDVLYSPRALQWLRDDVPLRFLSRLMPSRVSGKAAAELFGFRATGQALADLYRTMKRLTRRDMKGPKRLWTLWDNTVNPPTVDLNDYTDDIDSPEEYVAFWPAMLKAATS